MVDRSLLNLPLLGAPISGFYEILVGHSEPTSGKKNPRNSTNKSSTLDIIYILSLNQM